MQLRAEGRRDNGQIGCIQEIKVLRKDLVAISSHGHLGRWFERSACAEFNSVSAKG
jgi:hypothetical protein